jgi:hypothetical protein
MREIAQFFRSLVRALLPASPKRKRLEVSSIADDYQNAVDYYGAIFEENTRTWVEKGK